jgi:hypothetical protein
MVSSRLTRREAGRVVVCYGRSVGVSSGPPATDADAEGACICRSTQVEGTVGGQEVEAMRA